MRAPAGATNSFITSRLFENACRTSAAVSSCGRAIGLYVSHRLLPEHMPQTGSTRRLTLTPFADACRPSSNGAGSIPVQRCWTGRKAWTAVGCRAGHGSAHWHYRVGHARTMRRVVPPAAAGTRDLGLHTGWCFSFLRRAGIAAPRVDCPASGLPAAAICFPDCPPRLARAGYCTLHNQSWGSIHGRQSARRLAAW